LANPLEIPAFAGMTKMGKIQPLSFRLYAGLPLRYAGNLLRPLINPILTEVSITIGIVLDYPIKPGNENNKTASLPSHSGNRLLSEI
jgi:hypothetical protein